MQKLITERGITLIALIITIIVMLILVGVSVTVALEGGLFTTAKQATNKTQLELDKEQLLELALGAIDNRGKVEYPELIEAVDGKFTVTGEGEDATYTSKSGNKFVVNEWGSVEEAPVYELSGRWKFVDNPNPQMGESAGTIVSQDISFTSLGEVMVEDPEGGPATSEINTVTYNSIKATYDDYENLGTGFVLTISYDNTCVYYLATGEWSVLTDNTDVKVVNFGSEPQEVSKEFYDWFTANATQE